MNLKEYTFELEASPYAWYLYAQELREAANIIIRESPNQINRFPDFMRGKVLNNAFFLNFGLSIENLLKGTLVAENPKYIDHFRIADSISKGHDLLNLAKDLKSIRFSKKEIEVLKFLSGAIPNWGKYPIPKTSQKLEKRKDYNPELHARMEDIWSRLIKNLYEMIKDGNWSSPNGLRTGFFRDSTMEKDMDIEIQSLNIKIGQGKADMGNVDFEKTIYKENKIQGNKNKSSNKGW